MLIWILLAVVVLAAAGAVWVRIAPSDPADWRADPTAAERTGRPNDYLVADGGDETPRLYAADPEALIDRVAEWFAARERTEVLARDGAGATFVERSALMRFPDYISVKAEAGPEGTALSVWSRSRFGYSDRGVNRARVSALLKVLKPLER